MRPTNGRQAAASPAGGRSGTGAPASTRPLMSCVSVVIPKRTVATYSLSWSTRYGISFVASPIRTGSTPVAAGSTVPPGPTRPPPGPLHAALGRGAPLPRVPRPPQQAGDAHGDDGARIVDQLLGLDEALRQGAGRQREPRQAPVVAQLPASQRLARPGARRGRGP